MSSAFGNFVYQGLNIVPNFYQTGKLQLLHSGRTTKAKLAFNFDKRKTHDTVTLISFSLMRGAVR